MNVERVVTGNYGTNCYLLENEDAAIVIDPGENDERIIAFAKRNANKKEKAILLTHCHFDHILGVNDLKAIFTAPVIASKIEQKGLMDDSINLSTLAVKQTVTVTADKTVQDNDTLTFGGEKIDVILTPGHTAGGVCFIIGDLLFSGDTHFRLTIGRYDLPTANFDDLLLSLKKIKNLKGDYLVYPGHGAPTTLEFERKNNHYLKD